MMVALSRMTQWSRLKWLHLIAEVPLFRETEWAAPPRTVGSWQCRVNKPRWVWFSTLVPQHCTRLPLDGAALPRLFWTQALPDRLHYTHLTFNSQAKRKKRKLGNTAPPDSRWWVVLRAKPRNKTVRPLLSTGCGEDYALSPSTRNPAGESGRGSQQQQRLAIHGDLDKSGTSLSPPAQQPTTHTDLIGHFQGIK